MSYNHLDWQLRRAWEQKIAMENSQRPSTPRVDEIPSLHLRCWCLVVRADDRRLPMEAMSWREHPDHPQHLQVGLYRGSLEQLCQRVHIPPPGISVAQAAGRFGVNPTTIRRWIRRGLLRQVQNVNRADRKRSRKQVWTPRAVDPTGEVFHGPWGALTDGLVRKIDDHWTQFLELRQKNLSSRSRVRQWRCPGCGRWFAKLYLPVPITTMSQILGPVGGRETSATADAIGQTHERWQGDFACRHCHAVVYESAEATCRPGPGRKLNPMDRFVKRFSGGVLCGRDL